jgi:hypothetical protein
MNDNHPTYFLAAAAAIIAAVALKIVGLPGAWPPAIALYIYGLVAWPVLREQIPSVRPMMYAAIWVGAGLFVFVCENLGAYVGKN